MIRLASILYSIVATTLAGIGVIAVLTAGYDTTVPIIVAAAIGAVIALPVSYLVAGKIINLTSS
ncbi:CTP synthetase [Sulfitobacter sp.]|uniref:CTP synthetase n=1 Tax=Sulfitobacter sp. TaxID=1903071 RepID=UPI003003815E